MDGQPPDTTHDRRQHGLTGATALHRWPALLVVGLLAIFGLRAPPPHNGEELAALLQRVNMPVTVHQVPLGVSNAYLLESDASLVLVDAGLPGSADAILAAVDALGKPLTLIYITHAHIDHYGSAAEVRRRTGAPIAVHAADADALAAGGTRLGSLRLLQGASRDLLALAEPLLDVEPAPPDVLVADGDSLAAYGIDATVLHTPGHTPGSTTLLLNDGQVAIAGDLLSNSGGAHAQRTYADDWTALAESIERIQDAAPVLTYAGHGSGPIVAGDLQAVALDPVDPLSAEGLASYYEALIGAWVGGADGP